MVLLLAIGKVWVIGLSTMGKDLGLWNSWGLKGLGYKELQMGEFEELLLLELFDRS